jgi:acyl-CoA synthetase (AMP-forming)/AMP-acid ligase II
MHKVHKDEDFSGAALVTSSSRYEFFSLRNDSWSLKDVIPRGGELAVVRGGPLDVLAVLAALDGWCSNVHLVPDESLLQGIDWEKFREVTAPTGATWLLRDQFAVPTESQFSTQWTLYSSGTTGVPKAVGHSLSSLTRTVSRSSRPLVWGLLYDPNRMAGLQVLLQAFSSDHSVVAPEPSTTLSKRIELLREHKVTAVSATPTIWRQILQTKSHVGWGLEQITLGGEISDQLILDALRRAFPNSRITHVFASTESAAAFSISDCRAGFPLTFLNDPPAGIELKICDNELRIYNPHSSAAEVDGFVSTGDAVEIREDEQRVLFRGRASGVVNVGGMNVWPEQAEALLRQHPDIQDASVSSVSNPLSGNLFVARVVVKPGTNHDSFRRGVRRWVRERAPNALVPARVEIVAELDLNTAGKIVR